MTPYSTPSASTLAAQAPPASPSATGQGSTASTPMSTPSAAGHSSSTSTPAQTPSPCVSLHAVQAFTATTTPPGVQSSLSGSDHAFTQTLTPPGIQLSESGSSQATTATATAPGTELSPSVVRTSGPAHGGNLTAASSLLLTASACVFGAVPATTAPLLVQRQGLGPSARSGSSLTANLGLVDSPRSPSSSSPMSLYVATPSSMSVDSTAPSAMSMSVDSTAPSAMSMSASSTTPSLMSLYFQTPNPMPESAPTPRVPSNTTTDAATSSPPIIRNLMRTDFLYIDITPQSSSSATSPVTATRADTLRRQNIQDINRRANAQRRETEETDAAEVKLTAAPVRHGKKRAKQVRAAHDSSSCEGEDEDVLSAKRHRLSQATTTEQSPEEKVQRRSSSSYQKPNSI